MTEYNLAEEFKNLMPVDKIYTLDYILEELKEDLQGILRGCIEDKIKASVVAMKFARGIAMIESAVNEL